MPQLPPSPVSSEVAAAEGNYLAVWKLLVAQSNGGEVMDTAEALFTVVPAPVAFFTGLVPSGRSPLMNVSTGVGVGSTEVEVRPVTADSWDDHLLTVASGFGMPLAMVRAMFAPSLLEATTRAAVTEGHRRGCDVATLPSSELGYSVYERIGFRTVAHWTNFTG